MTDLARMTDSRFELRPIGRVESSLTDLASAPMQAFEDAPEAWLVFDEAFVDGLAGLAPGDRVVVITWLDRADRSVLRTHPRDDAARPISGVFNTRSPARPNPIGLHPTEIVEIDGARVLVDALEAIDGTPVLDLKPLLRRA